MSLKIDMYISVADPAAPPPPPLPFPLLIFRPNWGPKRISKGLDDRGPPLSQQDLDPALHFVASNLSPLWNTTLPLLLGFAQTSLFFLLRELKQQRFWATDVNGKWTFYISEQWFGWNSRVNCLYKRKDTKQYKFVSVKADKKGEGLTSGWRA